MPSLLYNSFLRDIGNGSIDLDTDTFKVMLTTSTYTENKDTHTKRSDITNEITGTGYTAGGATLASVTWTVDNTNDRVTFDAADSSWTTATITARKAVIYKSRGGAASADELVAVFDFASDFTSTAGTFTLQWNAAGILRLNNP
jgi:hypothetical protein